ncbi:MAG: hypothetical protein HOC71_11930, partial [Candidatus Latescibacteria bacterium]|nr:hypothetical protein [Candidatus Latescibacterota bacterium]
LNEAKAFLGNRIFIKGNIDSVNTLLMKNQDEAMEEVRQTLEWGKPGGAYILSTACSVAPHVKPESLEALVDIVENHGRYE